MNFIETTERILAALIAAGICAEAAGHLILGHLTHPLGFLFAVAALACVPRLVGMTLKKNRDEHA